MEDATTSSSASTATTSASLVTKSFVIVSIATICGLGLVYRSSPVDFSQSLRISNINTDTIIGLSKSSSSSSSESVMKDASESETIPFSLLTSKIDSHVNKATTKPNIVIILADDLAYQNLGGYNTFSGAQDLSGVTPILTELAQNGLVMGNYYAMETCTPSRAAMLTGRYPLTIGMQYGVVEMDKGWGLPLEEETLADVLKDAGYKTHIVGKWHLGHHSPMYLPTARGFATFTGFVDSENYYFSKKSPSNDRFYDFMVSDGDCYYTYNGPSLHNYSTHLYREIAVNIIKNHEPADPLFLYLAFNAVHVPFNDIPDEFPRGYREIPDSWLGVGVKEKLDANVVGEHRRLYAATLNELDTAVGRVRDALVSRGLMDNTYIIFASDNGGCYLGGGKNAPLRGNKATLLEGGTKVDAFVYSPLMDAAYRGTVYNGLFHVTDWFPTILEIAGVDYSERDGFSLDGVSQVPGIQGDADIAREHMLYNSYTNVAGEVLDMWTSGAFAIRNQQYKLIHYYENDDFSGYQTYMDVNGDDMLWTSKAKECKTLTASVGVYSYGLFDLVSDPYEENNLYYSTDSAVTDAKNELYALVIEYNSKAAKDVYNQMGESKIALKMWQNEGGGYVIPWTDPEKGKATKRRLGSSSSSMTKVKQSGSDYPSFCGPTQSFSVYSWSS